MIDARQLKVKALETAMKNPRLAKLISTAARSPLGSTDRSKAQSVIGSLYNTQLNHVQSTMLPTILANPQGQGQGGGKSQPQVMLAQPPEAPQKIVLKPATLTPYNFQRPKPKPMSVMPPATAPQSPVPTPMPQPMENGKFLSGVRNWLANRGPQSPVPQPQAPSIQSQPGYLQRIRSYLGGVGAGGGKGGGLPSNTTYNPLSVVSSPGSQSISLGTVGPQPNISVGSAGQQPNISVGRSNSNYGVNYNPLGNINNPLNVPGPNLQNTYGSKLSPSNQFPNLSNGSILGPTAGPKPITPSTSPVNLANLMSSPGLTFNQTPGASVPNPDTTTDTSGSMLPNGSSYGPPSPGTVDASGNYTATGDPLVDYLMQSYQKGIGSNAFALGAMADSKKLQELLPGVPANKLPVGASLAGQLQGLQDALYKESGLDNLHTTLNNAIAAGQNLPETATAYIRGKDEFLNSVDKMQKNVQDQFNNSSMRSDPFYKANMEQYNNYLSILKGRATQRYVDYLNTATTYQNNQVSALETQYNTLADQVNRKYTAQAAVTTEQYNDIKTSLIAMYDNIANRQQLQDANALNQINIQKSYYEMIKAAAEANKASLAGGGKALNATELKSIDDNVGHFPNVISALQSPTFQGYDPAVVLERYTNARAATIKNDVGTSGSVSSLWSADKNNLKQLQDNSSTLNITNLPQQAQQYVDSVNKGYSEGILKYLQDHKDAIYTIVNRMKGHQTYDQWKNSGTGFLGLGAKEGNKWVTTSGSDTGKITDDMARLLFNAVKAQQASGGSFDPNSFTVDELAGAMFGQLN